MLRFSANGVEMNKFGLAKSTFAHAPDPPIMDVVILLGGAKGSQATILRDILGIFQKSLMWRLSLLGYCYHGRRIMRVHSVSFHGRSVYQPQR